jgi:hypothetical protein
MPYQIRSLDFINFQKKNYFFDANLWLKILKPQFNLSKRDEKYLNFFEKFSNHINHPVITVTALLLSEIINRYLRDVTYIQFCKKQGQVNPPKSYYKEVYRATKQFENDYISLCEDIKTYQNIYKLFPDGFGTDLRQKDILTSPSVHLDFNDHYYYKMALKYNFTIVTDDKDFFVPDVEILTYNNQLIDRGKGTIEII